MLSGLVDQVVPPSHMQALWKVAQERRLADKADESGEADLPAKSGDAGEESNPDKMVTFPRGTHSESFPLLVCVLALMARYA